MLEGLMKGLAVWLYDLLLEIVEFIADSLLEVFNMDLAYFETNVPVTSEIVKIIMAAGWAILIGNLTFQAIKSMMSGIGFEGEDPKILFCRTFVFSFLLVASRQICEIGLGMASRINTLLQMPDAVRLGLPPLDVFAIPGSWLLVIIMGVVVMFQIVKFFFEIAERYVVLVMLTILSPLAFGVGGSKNTEDIFKGWARMFGSSCLMMLFNTVFLKLLLSAMSNTPSAVGMLPWMLLVVAIARVARKIDEIVARIGLNTARTGEPIGRGGIMYPIMVARTLGQLVTKTAGAGKATPRTPPSGRNPGGSSAPSVSPPPPPSSGPTSGGGAAHQTQQNSGGTSSTANGVPVSTPATATPPSAQPAMSTATLGMEKESPPSRPPIGVGRPRYSEPLGGQDGTRRDTVNAEQGGNGRPPLSVDSATPGAIRTERPENTSQRDGNADKAENSRTSAPPPLSVDSRTPDMSGTMGQKPLSAQASTENSRRSTSRKPVNIDIYRDDEPLDGRRSGSAYRGRSPVSAKDVSRSGGSHIQNTHTNTNSATTRQAIQESTKNTANAVNSGSAPPSTQNPPPRASSPGAGRIGGLNQPDAPSRSGGLNQSGGTTVPGNPHRATSISGQERPSRVSPPVSDGARPQPAASLDTRNGAKPSRANAPATAQPHSVVHPQNHSVGEKSVPVSEAIGRPTDAQKPRPMRYKRVDRNGTHDVGKNNADQPPAARPAPGRQPTDRPDSPSRGSATKGGKRP